MNGHHRSPVSSLCLDYDEKGFFSAGWDGTAIVRCRRIYRVLLLMLSFQQWDLNTGQSVRNFTAHNAQLTTAAIRPLAPYYNPTPGPIYNSSQQSQANGSSSQAKTENMDTDTPAAPLEDTDPFMAKLEDTSQLLTMDDARSDASFDPLFDDVPEEPMHPPPPAESKLAMPGSSQMQSPFFTREPAAPSIPPPKGAPPLIDAAEFQTYSPDLLMTAFIDGQVILWDRRVQTSGKGVGRLWMNEKTPPWCLSVSASLLFAYCRSADDDFCS